MKTFADNAGRTWTVTVNVDAVKRVRSLCSVNLLEIVEGDLLGRLANDPVLLCDVLFAVCKSEADAKGISDEEFGRAMGGDAIEAATAAFLEELVGFFPSPRRAVLHKALDRLRALETRALQAVETRLDDPRLLERIETHLAGMTAGAAEAAEKPSGGSSGNWPASSASIPDR